MPVVLTDDIDNYKSKQVSDYADSLGDPFAPPLKPIPPMPTITPVGPAPSSPAGAGSPVVSANDYAATLGDPFAPAPSATPSTPPAAPSPSAPYSPSSAPLVAPVASPSLPAPDAPVTANMDPTEAYIRQAAQARGIDPNVAVKVYHSEGANSYIGDNGSSFGPFQLHYGGVAAGGNAVAGLGDTFTAQTGLNARDPNTVNQQIDFTLDQVKKGGWGPWHGAATVGVGNQDGIGTATASAPPSVSQPLAQGDPLAKAKPFIGSTYVWGGKSPDQGFDCSGLAGYLAGTGQPESTRTLYAKSTPISAADAQPGDLVFYHMQGSTGPADEHVATSIGNGQIVQAGGQAHNVNIADANQFSAPGWQPEYRRLTGTPTVAKSVTATSASNPVGDAVGGAINAVGQAKDAVGGAITSAWDHAKSLGDPFAAVADSTGQGLLTSGEVNRGTVDTVGQAVAADQANPPLAPVGSAIANSGANQFRHDNFPNITEPGHPLNQSVTTDANGQSSLDPNTIVAVGGMTGTVGAGKVAAAATNDILSSVAKYSPEIRSGLEDFVQEQTRAGQSLKDIGDTVAEWIRNNPPQTETPALTAALSEHLSGRESSGPATPTRGQLGLFDDQVLPHGNPDPLPNPGESRGPSGRQPGQLGMGIGEQYQQDMVPPGDSQFQTPQQSAPESAQDPDYLRRALTLKNLRDGAPATDIPYPTRVRVPDEPGALVKSLARPEVAQNLPLPEIPDVSGTTSQKLSAVRYGSMLSSWYTHVGNIAANVGQAGALPLREAVAGHPGIAGARIHGMLEGIPDGLAAMWDTLQAGASRHGAETPATKLEAEIPHAFGTGKVGHIMEAPGTLLTAADDFFKGVTYAGSLRADATRLAKGDPEMLQTLLNSPTAQMVRNAKQTAAVATYTEHPGALVQSVMNWKQGLDPNSQLAVNFLIPFVRTPANILRRGALMTAKPLTGPIQVGKALARGDTEAARMHMADTLISTAFTMGFVAKATNGELTGDGPQDTQLRAAMEAQGTQWHSIRVGDHWVDYSWAGPLGIQMGLIANAWEAHQYTGAAVPSDQQAMQIVNGVKGALLQQSMLRGIGDLFKNTQSGAASQVASFLGSSIPFGGALNAAAQATDPYNRKADPGPGGIPSRLAERVPGLRNMVPLEKDTSGNAVSNPMFGVHAFRGGEAKANPAVQPLIDPLPIKYVGVTDKAQEKAIDDARSKVSAYLANPRQAPRPTADEQRLAFRYEDAISPRYTQAGKARDRAKYAQGFVAP